MQTLKKTNNFYLIVNHLFILLPFFLITGPFLSDISVSLIAIFFIFISVKKKLYSYYNNIFFKIFIIFWLYIVFNSLINNQNLDSLKISFFYFRLGFFSLGVWFLIEKNPDILKKFTYSLLICFSILILDGYLQYFTGSNILGNSLGHGSRVSSFFGEELILGSYLSRLFPILFGLTILLFRNDKKKIYIVSSIFVLAEVLVFLSGERSAFFYINLSALYIILLIKDFKKLRFITLIISISLITLISISNPLAKNRIVDNTLDQFGVGKDTKYIFSKQHTHHYITAYKMFKDNIFFGVGVKNFRNYCSNDKYKVSHLSCSTHPHNTYLQLLSEIGLLGFMFIFGFFIYICQISLTHFIGTFKKKLIFNDFEICILSAFLISLWPPTPTGNFFNNYLSIIYYLPIGMFLWSLSNKKKYENFL